MLAVATQGLISTFRVVEFRGLRWVAFAIAEFALIVAPIATSGRPVGARVLGTVVVRANDLTAPGWLTSGRRWLVAHLPLIVVTTVLATEVNDAGARLLTGLNFAALAVIYGAILVTAQQQGLHDKAAETIVVLHEPAGAGLPQRAAVPDPRQIAVEDRKAELMSMQVSDLRAFASGSGKTVTPSELATLHVGFRVDVAVIRRNDSAGDVLFLIEVIDQEPVFRPDYRDGFAVRAGESCDDLTDDEWLLFD